jgi:hypothetical protein
MVMLALSLAVAAGLIVLGCSADRRTTTGGTEPTPSNLKVLEKAAADYIEQRSRQSHWNVLEQEIKLLSKSAGGGKVIAVYDIHLRHTLDYHSPEEAPVLRGKLRWLREHEKELSREALDRARKEIEMWRKDLADYISTPQDAYERLKVEGVRGKDGEVCNIKILCEDPVGSYILPEEIPSDAQVEQDAYRSMEELVKQER